MLYSESDKSFHRELIKEHLLVSYVKIIKGKESVKTIINAHKKYIKKFDFNNKRKYKTLSYLISYDNCNNKACGIQILTNTLNNMNLFSSSASETARTP